MTFSLINFLFMYLPILLLLYVITPAKYKNITLFLGSLVFYAWGNVSHVVLLLLLIALNFFFGHYIERSNGRIRKLHLIEAIVVNVSVLLYFKYYGFVLDTIFALFPHPPAYSLFSVPLGISFFTFSIVAYLVDVYRKKIVAERNFLYFGLFVSFFPKLVMGPIERYDTMRKQMEYHPMRSALFEQGCSKFIVGLAQKLVLANTMGMIWSLCQTSSLSMAAAWLGILAYTFQIYFDFQGYTQMAIGLGNMFGFQLSENFRYPYTAISITDFWRRWHITLSSWFRDYIYIPLGGNRTSQIKILRNLMIVWALTGLWHGANWNFICWGLYYGVLLILEKYVFHSLLEKIPGIIRWMLTFLAVMIGWVFFASNGIAQAFGYLGNMFMLRGNPMHDVTAMSIISNYGIYYLFAAIGCTPFMKNAVHRIMEAWKDQLWYIKPIATLCFVLILLSFLVSNTYQAFLYFQF